MISELDWLLSILVGGGNIRPDKTLIIISITYVYPMSEKVFHFLLSFSTVPAQAEFEQRFLCYLKLLTSSCLLLSTGPYTPYAKKCRTTREMHFQRKNWTWSGLLFTLAACMVGLHKFFWVTELSHYNMWNSYMLKYKDFGCDCVVILYALFVGYGSITWVGVIFVSFSQTENWSTNE